MKNFFFEASSTVFNHISMIDKSQVCDFGKAYSFWATPSTFLTGKQAQLEADIRFIAVKEALQLEPLKGKPFPTMVVITNPEVAVKVDARIQELTDFLTSNGLDLSRHEMVWHITKPMADNVFLKEDMLSAEAIAALQKINLCIFGEELTAHGLIRRARFSLFNKQYAKTLCFAF